VITPAVAPSQVVLSELGIDTVREFPPSAAHLIGICTDRHAVANQPNFSKVIRTGTRRQRGEHREDSYPNGQWISCFKDTHDT
jgi:hypothetical protein